MDGTQRGESSACKLLVALGDPKERAATVHTLERAGYRVTPCAGAGEAAALVRSERPDLVLLDVPLPGGDGLETVRVLPSTPDPAVVPAVVLFTGGGSGRDPAASQGLCGGWPQRSLARPVSEETLLSTVRSLLPLRSMESCPGETPEERHATPRGIGDAGGTPGREERVQPVFPDTTDGKNPEETLREERDFSQAALDSLPGLFYLFDDQGRLLRWNRNLEAVSGYSAEEISRMSPGDFFREPGKTIIQEAIRRALLTGEAVAEGEFVSKDGGRTPFLFTGRLFHFEQKPCVIGMGVDIAERLQAREEAERAHRDWRGIFEAIGHPTFVLNPDYEILAANRAAADAVGLSPGELTGRKCHEVFHGTAEPPPDCPIRTLRATGVLTTAEMPVETLGGTFLVSCTPVFDEAGRLEKIIHIATDITRQNEAEQALRRSEEHYRLLADNTADVIAVMDKELRHTYVSPSVQRLRGFSPEEARVQSLEQILTPESVQVAWKVFQEEMALEASGTADPKRVRVVELEEYRKDGSTVWAEVSLTALRDPDGEVRAVVSVTRDITERKQAEDRHRELEAQFHQAQKMESVGRLAGGVAHDFNNMLSIILGHAELALEKMGPRDPLRENLREILTAGRRSSDLVQQLLAFARKQIIAPKVLDLNATIDGTLKMLVRLIGEEIDFVWKPAGKLWPVLVDPVQVNQILANLVVNARDAISGHGTITLETGRATFDAAYCRAHEGFQPGQYVRVSVSDNGCGMDGETLENLFEPFFTTKEQGKGTGLGLATVYGIVQQNHGFIRVESRPGQGTTVSVFLPRHEGEPAAPGEALPHAPASPGTETVLVVEDESVLLELATAMLEPLGYTVLTAGTPNLALRRAEQHAGEIHVLVSDMVMPEMSGYELWQRLRERRPNLRCLFMSGYPSDVFSRHGVMEQDVPFLEKPFSARALAAKLREVLDRSESA